MSDPIHAVCPHCGKTNRLPAERVGQHPDCGACGQPLFQGKPIEMDDARFQDYLRRTDLPVVVDFWASWCGPCRMAAPVLEKIADEYEGRLKVCKVNIDDNRQIAMQYHIMSIPTMLLFKDGERVDQITGVTPNFESDLKRKIEPYVE